MTHLQDRGLVVLAARCFSALLVLVLSACASLPALSPEPPPPPVEPGWRVVERVGQAVALPRGQSTWARIEANTVLPPGTELATGGASRLIIDRSGSQVTLGPLARVVLPEAARGDRLDQQDGPVRYRIAGAEAGPFRIAAGSARAEARRATFDVELRPLQQRTMIEVSAGEVRVMGRDGTRGTTLWPGQAALAEALPEPRLALRAGMGQPFEPVVEVAAADQTVASEAAGVSASMRALAVTTGAAPQPERATIRSGQAAAVPALAARRTQMPAAPSAAVTERAIVPAAFEPGPTVLDGAPAIQEQTGAGSMRPVVTPAAAAPSARNEPTVVAPAGAAEVSSGHDPVFDSLVRGMLDGLPRASAAPRSRARW